MFVLAFIPMLLVAFAYKELSQDTPDRGTTFTWGTKAFGPWIGWIGGWGLAVSAIIVLANVAEVAAVYLSVPHLTPRSARSCWPSLLSHHRPCVRVVFPAQPVHLGAKPVHARHLPLLGAIAMTWAFVQSAVDMMAPDYGYTAFGPLGGVFVLGVGMLVLASP